MSYDTRLDARTNNDKNIGQNEVLSDILRVRGASRGKKSSSPASASKQQAASKQGTMATGDDEDSTSASDPHSKGESDVGISERPNAIHQRVQSASFRSLGTDNALDEQRGKIARAMSTREAMGSQARRRSYLGKALSPLRKRRVRWRNDDDEIDDDMTTTSMHGRLTVTASHMHSSRDTGYDSDEETGSNKSSKGIQYRLSAHTPRNGMFYRFLRSIGVTVGDAGIFDDAGGNDASGFLCCGVSPNRWVTTYLNWTFRASFFKVIFSAAIGFYTLTLTFALLIFWSGTNHPDCVHVNGQNFGDSGRGDRFGDAYALSWTTFSTVVCCFGVVCCESNK